jgi:hypothetical protein
LALCPEITNFTMSLTNRNNTYNLVSRKTVRWVVIVHRQIRTPGLLFRSQRTASCGGLAHFTVHRSPLCLNDSWTAIPFGNRIMALLQLSIVVIFMSQA